METLTKVGLAELAVGGIAGWAVVVSMESQWLERIGVRAPRRILQAHLDFILMGLILVAVGLALPSLPSWIAVVLAIGTWVNPLLFVPLAFDPAIRGWRSYRSVSAASFLCVSGGLVAVLVVALGR